MQRNVFDWGSVDAAVVWPITIRVLIVIDGRINLTKDPSEFGLGYVLDSLRAPFAWWVRFHVDVARHDDVGGNEPLLAYPKPFRFTDPSFDIDAYDQIWFFADRPNRRDGADGAMTDEDIRNDEFRLSDAELKLVAEWMDRGDGVFATGDHTVLGAAMCHRIPRVRSMRRWTVAQDVPPRDAPGRHETLQPVTGADPETDTILQPLELVYQGGPFVGPWQPHPLFQSAHGVVDRFPDHMHEGEIIPDDEVRLDWPLDISGYGGAEYPSVPAVLASGLTGDVSPFQRPRPRVVAYGRTTNPIHPGEVADVGGVLPLLAFPNAGSFGITKRFGLVGVYDGDRAGIGRVVVDSTWHHWLSLNIDKIAKAEEPLVVAFKASALGIEVRPVAYSKMQAYYRNVALWLATPAQRRSMLLSSVWGILTAAPPMAFSVADSGWRIGKTLVEALNREMPRGLAEDLVGAFLQLPIVATAMRTAGDAECAPLSADVVSRAIVGGIASTLLEPALEHREKADRGLRPSVDGEAIRRRAVEGASRGHALLSQYIDDAAAAIGAIQASFRAAANAEPIDVPAPPAARRLRFIATRLQLPDPRDPALVEGHVTATIRVRVGHDVIGARTLERVELPSFDGHGAVIDLGLEIGEAEVRSWERLSVDVLAGAWSAQQPVDPEAMRFEDALRDDPAGWIGEHAPARSQAWRLWYRIEGVERPPARSG
ncbi:MAG: hypothetical protein ACREQ8_05625 [Woeseiaceae bacterium]